MFSQFQMLYWVTFGNLKQPLPPWIDLSFLKFVFFILLIRISDTTENSEFNLATLKFKSFYCPRHEKSKSWLPSCFANFFKQKAIATSDLGGSSRKANLNDASYNKVQQKVRLFRSNDNKHPVIDDENIMDDLNTSTCVACIAEDNNFNKFYISREKLYNKQQSPLFKYHIGMCSLIFFSLATVLFVSDLVK